METADNEEEIRRTKELLNLKMHTHTHTQTPGFQLVRGKMGCGIYWNVQRLVSLSRGGSGGGAGWRSSRIRRR